MSRPLPWNGKNKEAVACKFLWIYEFFVSFRGSLNPLNCFLLVVDDVSLPVFLLCRVFLYNLHHYLVTIFKLMFVTIMPLLPAVNNHNATVVSEQL